MKYPPTTNFMINTKDLLTQFIVSNITLGFDRWLFLTTDQDSIYKVGDLYNFIIYSNLYYQMLLITLVKVYGSF